MPIKTTRFLHYISSFFALFALLVTTPISSLEKGKTPLPLTVSVIVPCHPLHVHFLPTLLEDLACQTTVPNEVVISISERHRVNEQEINALRQAHWPFDLKIVLSSERLFAGANRNVACDLALGDIFIFQDADDAPHPQRIEIIKHFFSVYKIKHLLHSWVGDHAPFEKEHYNVQEIHSHMLFSADQAFHYPFPVFFGACAISRRVFHSIRWPERAIRGEDFLFCSKIIQRFGSSLLIDAKLLRYATSGLPTKVERGIEYN